jgi:2-methylcitrate dehydratase PrpD
MKEFVPDITAHVAAFVANARFEDLPAQAAALLTDAITDAIGVGLIGSREPMADMLLRTIGTSEAASDHLLLGTRRRASALEASFYNGAIIHAVDYDDSSHPSYSHPSAHLVPVLMAVGRQFNRNGRDLLLAYALGLELEGKLGRALNIGHFLKGWHPTGTLGALASAVAAAKLIGLDADRTAIAIGIAASAAGGVRANFGSMTKPLHAGYAARSGALAGLLAHEGLTASPDVLENRYGYLALFSGSEGADSESFDRLGQPWEIATPYGIAIKPYPSCGSTHTAIEAALIARNELRGEIIASVQVGTNEMCSQTLVYTDPQTPLQGKYCMEFCIAAALVLGEITIGTFDVAFLRNGEIRELMKKITVGVDERVRHSREHGTVVTIRTASGRQIERAVPLAQGKPERWLSRENLWSKFMDCAGAVLSQTQAEAAFERLQSLSTVSSVNELLAPIDI